MVKDQIAKLIDVKSIVTIVLTAVFGILTLRGDITGQDFLTVFTVVVAFYYGTQSAKNAKNDGQNR